ncbi:MAG: phosphomevalonate kinase [Calditrichia bacterium]
MIQRSAPGKLILLGEYAVLENAPALVLAVDRLARVTLTARKGAGFRIHSPTLQFNNLEFDWNGDRLEALSAPAREAAPKLNFVLTALEILFTRFEWSRQTGWELTLNTDEFYDAGLSAKLGLGSSAAMTVALVRALLAAHSQQISTESLFLLAQQIHSQAQGKSGSGIDIAAAAAGGFIYFRKEPLQIRPVNWPGDWQIIPIFSGQSASTPQLVKQVRKLKEKHPAENRRLLEALAENSAEGCRAVEERDFSRFAARVERAQSLLRELGEKSGADIVSRPHQEIEKLVRDTGGYYKISGAGGGDLGLAFTNSPEIKEKIYTRFLHSPYKIVKLSPYFSGNAHN